VLPTQLLPSSVSLFDLKTRFSVPTRAGAETPSEAKVKARRRAALATHAPVSSSRLDGGEHGVKLPAVGTRLALASSALQRLQLALRSRDADFGCRTPRRAV
jgi:hypothetical protein